MLSKSDIAMMSDGQREILYVGMKMEQDRILSIIEELKKSNSSITIDDIKNKIKGGK